MPVVAVVDSPAVARPQIVVPSPYQASFGRLTAQVPPGTARVIVVVNGKREKSKAAAGGRVSLQITLPPRDSTLALLAVDRRGRVARSRPVGPVFGLPLHAAPRPTRAREDWPLRQRLLALLRSFPGTAAAFVQDLRTGAGAAWNARARFPAASTLKLAIAVEAMRSLRGPPAHGSSVDALMRSMLIDSDNQAANQLEVTFGGSTSGGSAKVTAMMRAVGLVDSEMYGGYEIDEIDARVPAERPIPIGVESQPSFPPGKYTTAADLGRLFRYVHLAAGGRGPLIQRFGGAFSPDEARYLLYMLAHVPDRGKLGRFLPGNAVLAHKAGWIAAARHDSGLVFWPGGAFVAAVMTHGRGVGTASDVLAGSVAKAALQRFKAARR
jgi:hypothetical protein